MVEVIFARDGDPTGHIRIVEGGQAVADRAPAVGVQPQAGLAEP